MIKTNSLKLGEKSYLKYFARKFLILLLVADIIYILLYVSCWLPSSSYLSQTISGAVLHQELLWLTEEQSYAEVFQYLKELWIVLILGFGAWQRKSFLLIAWALLFSYLLIDDSLSIHEVIGRDISNLLQFQKAFGLRAVDFGEVLVSATVAIGFLIIISWAYSGSNSTERKYSQFLTFFLLALAVTGVFLDLIHVVVSDNLYFNLIFALLEDGGEQIIMSFALSFVYAIDWQYDLHQEKLFKKHSV